MMGNHIKTHGKATTVMYFSADQKYIITETTIVDKRPVSYFTNVLLKKQIQALKGK